MEDQIQKILSTFGSPPMAVQKYLNIKPNSKDHTIYFLHSELLPRTDSGFRNFTKAAQRICSANFPDWKIEVRSLKPEEFDQLDVEKRRDELEKASEIQLAVTRLIDECASMGVTDIHIDSHPDKVVIRVRINGETSVLQEFADKEMGIKYISVIYNTMCEHSQSMYTGTEYQDAIFSRKALPGNLSGVRVSCGPSMDGPFMALRLLYVETIHLKEGVHPLIQLGYNEGQVEILEKIETNPSGVMFVAGPTGAGKTTTLKYIVTDMAKDPRNVWVSIEDPPEYDIPNVRQMPVTVRSDDDDRDTAFSKAIRAALRGDPDRMIIGEIRDSSSAALAIRAALGGHQVWTTIHADNTFGILDTMLALLVGPKYSERQAISLLSNPSIINGLMFQRLVPRLCPDCKVRLKDHPDALKPMHLNSLRKSLFEKYRITNTLTGATDEDATADAIEEAIMDNVYIVNPDPDYRCKNEDCHRGVIGRSVIGELVHVSQSTLDNVFAPGRGSAYAKKRWNNDNPDQTLQANARKLIMGGTLDPGQAIGIIGLLETDIQERESA